MEKIGKPSEIRANKNSLKSNYCRDLKRIKKRLVKMLPNGSVLLQ